MNDRQLLFILAAAFGLWLALVCVRLLADWLRLRRLVFGPGDVEIADRSRLPADLAAILDAAAPGLAALGFRHEQTLLIRQRLKGSLDPIWGDVYVHGDTGARALVQAADQPEPGMATAISFTTYYPKKTLQTENRRLHLFFPMPPEWDMHDAAATSLAEHWACHQGRMAAEPEPLRADAQEVFLRNRDLDIKLFPLWRESGFMADTGAGWRLTARGAWKYLRQVMASNRRLAALPPCADIEDMEVRLLADARAWGIQEAVLQQNEMPRRGKALWFGLSLLAGILAVGAITSWETVPVIFGVLLFHEFGHALAMRALGYRGLQVLVLPFLGAVAIGRKDDAGPWHKLLVLLAGPLPGLVLAVICLRLAPGFPQQEQLLTTVGAVALGINLFNLLPITPLDGGQLVDTFLFSAFPRLRFLFTAASAAALAALGWFLDSTVLAGAGLLLAVALPAAWRRQRLLAGLPSLAAGDEPVMGILERLHSGPGPRWPGFVQRMQTLRVLLPLVRGRRPRPLESLGGLLAYGLAIALPIGLLWDTGVPQQIHAQITRSVPQDADRDWDSELAATKTPEARWQLLWEAGQWHEEEDLMPRAHRYYKLALEESTGLPADSKTELRRLDARLALVRTGEFEAMAAAYRELLPELRSLSRDERWRLADALEGLDGTNSRAPAEERIARLQEAVQAREEVDSRDQPRLYTSRLQLARLLDAEGQASRAEALLLRNVKDFGDRRNQSGDWLWEPVAWFFISHGRAADGEARLQAQAVRPHAPSAQGWLNVARERNDAARALFSAELAKLEKREWSDWQRMLLLLDLVHASADNPAEEARWLQEAAAQKEKMKDVIRGLYQSQKIDAKGNDWEKERGQARVKVLKRLPGGDDLDGKSGNQCLSS